MQAMQGSTWRGRAAAIAAGCIGCLLTEARVVAIPDLDLWVEQERCVEFHWADCDINGCTYGNDYQCAHGFEHFVYGEWHNSGVSQDSEILEREIHATGHATGSLFNFPGHDGSYSSFSQLRVEFELPVQAVVDLNAQIEAEFTSGGSWWDWTYSYAMTLSLRDFCPDINGNDETGVAELLAVLSAWGRTCEPGCPEDFDGSSVVDLGDLLFVLESWGPCATESSPAPTGASDDPVLVRLETLEGLSLFDLSIRCLGDEYFERDDSVLLGPGVYVLEVEADSTRDVAPCGACCLEDGTCVDTVTAEICADWEGTYQGEDTTCAGTSCLGACCFDDGTCIEAMVESECVSAGGLFRGAESTCAIDCQTGACCFDDGTCIAAIEETCAAMGGTYVGDGRTCTETLCLGACCFADGTCEEATVEGECVAGGGLYRGDGSYCAMGCGLGSCGWLIRAPIDWEDNLCGEPDSCPLRAGPDIRWMVTIPADGAWRFVTCGSLPTVITADTGTCCGDEYRYEGYCGEVMIEDLVTGQIVFVTLEAADDCGPVRVRIDGPW